MLLKFPFAQFPQEFCVQKSNSSSLGLCSSFNSKIFALARVFCPFSPFFRDAGYSRFPSWKSSLPTPYWHVHRRCWLFSFSFQEISCCYFAPARVLSYFSPFFRYVGSFRFPSKKYSLAHLAHSSGRLALVVAARSVRVVVAEEAGSIPFARDCVVLVWAYY